MRIVLGLEYDGSGFSGWEAQRGRPTVQETLEGALAQVAAAPLKTVCAGRTDAGVHARNQTVHFDTGAERPQRAWVLGTNTKLPRSVRVTWARTVDTTFHARYSARSRHYRYAILNRSVAPGVLHGYLTWECRDLDAARMQSAAGHLLGEHDFSSFRALACQSRTPVRTVHRLEVTRRGALVLIDIWANAFLHHMVRNIAGALIAVGMGRHEPGWVQQVLEARDRTQGGVTAPPDGLYLMDIDYPERFRLPRVLPAPVVW